MWQQRHTYLLKIAGEIIRTIVTVQSLAGIPPHKMLSLSSKFTHFLHPCCLPYIELHKFSILHWGIIGLYEHIFQNDNIFIWHLHESMSWSQLFLIFFSFMYYIDSYATNMTILGQSQTSLPDYQKWVKLPTKIQVFNKIVRASLLNIWMLSLIIFCFNWQGVLEPIPILQRIGPYKCDICFGYAKFGASVHPHHCSQL